MNEIFFPSQYKKALLNKTKNSTIRFGKEIGKYKLGRVYSAKSYTGMLWNIKIKIISIFPTTLNKLFEFGIPKQSSNAIIRKYKISSNAKVELIRFKVL